MLRRITMLAACAVLALLLSGCVVTSANPIYTSEDKNYMEELLGSWQIPGAGIATFKRVGPESNDYWVTSTNAEGGNPQHFLGVIADIGTSPYLDLLMLTTDEAKGKDKMDKSRVRELIKGDGGHMFMKLFIFDDQVSVASSDADWMHKYLEKNSSALEHKDYMKDGKDVSSGKTEVTARTGLLRKFIGDHFTEGLFGPAVRLQRIAGADELGGPDLGGIDK